jgi:5-formyltetrahydrofolate cyclo-ligase
MLFAPIAGELDLSPIILAARERGLLIYLPRSNWADRTMVAALAPTCDELGNFTGLTSGRHGIREPGPEAPTLDAAKLDLVLVPGLAFDSRGGRLGRGAGFYDRFLADLRAQGGRATLVALALDTQIVEGLPMDRHDVYMDLVLTPTRTLGPGRFPK